MQFCSHHSVMVKQYEATYYLMSACVKMLTRTDMKHTLQISDGTFRRRSLTSNLWFRRSLQPQTAGPQKVVSANERSCFIIFMFRATQNPCTVDRLYILTISVQWTIPDWCWSIGWEEHHSYTLCIAKNSRLQQGCHRLSEDAPEAQGGLVLSQKRQEQAKI